MLDRLFAWLRTIHDRYARVILAGIAALLVPLMALTLVATADNWRQDKERDQLLACFDDYAATSSTGSQAVREAAVAKDEATARRDLAFQNVLALIGTHPAKGDPDAARIFALLFEANADLVAAQDGLDAARADNPIPPAPSVFCQTD